ncbi:MAG TPA: tetratricopeptide repeat protein [Allosphingosinicella sp.]|jgi:TolA-binding protein|nr:tetratricopeptide repeat protein [Allosphingosinicella sp.]
MRFHLIAAMLLAGAAFPAAAQRAETNEQRIERLEQQLRAVQRRVFPNGQVPSVQPEIQPQAAQPGTARPAGSTAVADLNARVDALEAQLAALTGAIEENGNRTRQMEEALSSFRQDAAARLTRLEAAPQVAAAPAPAAQQPATRPAAQPPASDPAPTPSGGASDPAEAAYNAGFRLWELRRYEEAQTALQQVGERWPRSRWASWANNLAGRAFLDDNKPATAARIFLANYQGNPEGERAADSLYFLGQSLVALNRRPEACRVYDELASTYPAMRSWLRERLPEARRTARCTAAAAR